MSVYIVSVLPDRLNNFVNSQPGRPSFATAEGRCKKLVLVILGKQDTGLCHQLFVQDQIDRSLSEEENSNKLLNKGGKANP